MESTYSQGEIEDCILDESDPNEHIISAAWNLNEISKSAQQNIATIIRPIALKIFKCSNEFPCKQFGVCPRCTASYAIEATYRIRNILRNLDTPHHIIRFELRQKTIRTDIRECFTQIKEQTERFSKMHTKVRNRKSPGSIETVKGITRIIGLSDASGQQSRPICRGYIISAKPHSEIKDLIESQLTKHQRGLSKRIIEDTAKLHPNSEEIKIDDLFLRIKHDYRPIKLADATPVYAFFETFQRLTHFRYYSGVLIGEGTYRPHQIDFLNGEPIWPE